MQLLAEGTSGCLINSMDHDPVLRPLVTELHTELISGANIRLNHMKLTLFNHVDIQRERQFCELQSNKGGWYSNIKHIFSDFPPALFLNGTYKFGGGMGERCLLLSAKCSASQWRVIPPQQGRSGKVCCHHGVGDR